MSNEITNKNKDKGDKNNNKTEDPNLSWKLKYGSTGSRMARNNLYELTGNTSAADVLTPRQWAGVDAVAVPASINNGSTTSYVVNPLQQATINQAKQSGMVTTLPNTINNYVDYATDAINNAYNSGRITATQKANLAKQVQAQMAPSEKNKTNAKASSKK